MCVQVTTSWALPAAAPLQHHLRPYVAGSSARSGPAVPAAAAAAEPAVAGQASSTDPSSNGGGSGSGGGGGSGVMPGDRTDAFALVREEIECVTERLRRDIFTEIPALERAAEYFFRAGAEGKRLRSTMLLLMASALAPAPPGIEALTVDTAPPAEHPPDARRRQQRIAEITELIHVASLLHDDVIDTAGTRRGKRSLNAVFGNKVGAALRLQPFCARLGDDAVRGSRLGRWHDGADRTPKL